MAAYMYMYLICIFQHTHMYTHTLPYKTNQFITHTQHFSFSTPRGSKASSSWLQFAFTMKHREKNNEIHKLFTVLPVEEKLIDGNN